MSERHLDPDLYGYYVAPEGDPDAALACPFCHAVESALIWREESVVEYTISGVDDRCYYISDPKPRDIRAGHFRCLECEGEWKPEDNRAIVVREGE